jgi:hypothetical protein
MGSNLGEVRAKGLPAELHTAQIGAKLRVLTAPLLILMVVVVVGGNISILSGGWMRG